MEQNRQEHTEAQRPDRAVGRAGPDAGPQRHPFRHGMQSQAQSDTAPTHRMHHGIALVVLIVSLVVFMAEVILVKGEDAQQHHHQDDTHHHPPHGRFDGVFAGNLRHPVGEEIIQGDAQNHARHKTRHHLGAGMSHPEDGRQPPPEQRHGDDGDGVPRQQQQRISMFHDGSHVQLTGRPWASR